jgi:hypothetical protein
MGSRIIRADEDYFDDNCKNGSRKQEEPDG